MNKKIISTLTVLLTAFTMSFGQNIPLKGIVKNSKTKTGLKNVNILFSETNKGCSTDASGYFSIEVPKGKYKVKVSCIGYETKVVTVNTKNAKKEITILLDESVTNIDEVKVTKLLDRTKGESTAKVNVPIRDVPVTVSSINRTLIEQTQSNNVNEALRYATGITPYVNYGGFQTFSMRGFGAPVIMVDGARDERMNLSNSAPLSTLASVERIEYLKGPSSVLYGHSAVGGILNIIRKQPSDEFHGNIQTIYGSWDTKAIEVGAGGLMTKNLTYRFDANLSDSKGWRNNKKKYANAYLALNYKIDKKNNLEFKFAANDDLYGTEAGLPTIRYDIFDKNGKQIYKKGDFPKGMDRENRYNDSGDFLRHKNFNISGKYTHSFNKESKLSFHATYSNDLIDYFSTEELSFSKSDSAEYNFYYLNYGKKKYIDVENLVRSYPLRFSHETDMYQHYLDYTNVFHSGTIKHSFLAGYYLSITDRTSFTGYSLGKDVKGAGLYGKVNIANPILNQGALITKFSGAYIYKHIANGIYAQDILDISKKFKAMVGFRFDNYFMDSRYAKVPHDRKTTDLTESKKIKNNSITLKAGVVYEPIEELSLYASYSSFFKPNRRTYNPNYIYINKDGNEFHPTENKEVFKPESGYQAEVGAKFDLNEKLQINASGFYIKKNNIIAYLGKDTIEDKRIYGQVGVVDSKGFDLELLWSPIQGLTMNIGYGYLEAKYQKFAKNKYAENKIEGNYRPHNPKDKLYFWAYYTVPKGVLKNLSLGLGGNYSASDFFNSYNTVEVDSYFFADIALGYTFKNAYLKFKLNNVFDKTYYNSAVYSTQFIPAEGRNYLFTVGYKF